MDISTRFDDRIGERSEGALYNFPMSAPAQQQRDQSKNNGGEQATGSHNSGASLCKERGDIDAQRVKNHKAEKEKAPVGGRLPQNLAGGPGTKGGPMN